MFNKITFTRAAAVVGIAVIAYAAGFFFHGRIFEATFMAGGNSAAQNSPCQKGFSLLNQNLDCGYDDNASRLQALDATLDSATKTYVSEGKATRASVWVRDLVSGQWAASNENEVYSPASLLKLPLLVAYYKFSELEPDVLNANLTYKSTPEANDPTLKFTAPTSLIDGKTYGVNDLLVRMIQNSDNGAALTLFAGVDPVFYNQTLNDLGIQLPDGGNTLDYITVRTYANIFRMLYNATYLNRQLSEQALDMMSSSTFKGIATPLPSSITVAHKFGERTVIAPDGTITDRELHDCGIVYKSPDPYVLCIMTEGQNFDDLLSVITDISQVVYTKI